MNGLYVNLSRSNLDSESTQKSGVYLYSNIGLIDQPLLKGPFGGIVAVNAQTRGVCVRVALESQGYATSIGSVPSERLGEAC